MTKTDYLTVTTNEEHHNSIMDELLPVLAHMGVASVYEGLYKLHSGGTLRSGSARGTAHQISVSGDFLRALQAQHLWHEYLAIISCYPHRVTRLDIAHDIPCHAPTELKQVKRRVEKGEIQLTRKKLNLQTQYSAIMSQDRHGDESGTIYLGARTAQVARLKVYDKAKEQFDKYKKEIPDTLRWELTLGRKAGLSLQDAYEPDPVFWHYMKNILPAPGGVPTWQPHESELTFPPRVTLLPAESMKRLLEGSELLPRLLTLADQIGPNGFEYLLRLLRQAHTSRTINPAIEEETPSRTAS